ncbi:hypothetical protein RRG08_044328 [Elysia crispata]|uniref:Uncharacterized protein n=1 Tax=Elysia crispata TaxID=231223 RepID=A0AAE1D5N5_9GAST|nr:hypothetical protein RRG08_044328 [Elysia crispata]
MISWGGAGDVEQIVSWDGAGDVEQIVSWDGAGDAEQIVSWDGAGDVEQIVSWDGAGDVEQIVSWDGAGDVEQIVSWDGAGDAVMCLDGAGDADIELGLCSLSRRSRCEFLWHLTKHDVSKNRCGASHKHALSRDWGNLEPCIIGLDPPGACYPGSGSVDQFVLVQLQTDRVEMWFAEIFHRA